MLLTEGFLGWGFFGFGQTFDQTCTRLHTCAAPGCAHVPRARGSFGNEPTELIFVRARSFTIVVLMQQDSAD
jgi:hypothetical protein